MIRMLAGRQRSTVILKLPPLSAIKAFGLIEAGLQQHARTVTSRSTESGSKAADSAPFFSILTPTHNTKPEWLAEAALSLLNQTFTNWEWCIVDDGSDNRETTKLLELLGRAGARVRVSASARFRHQRRHEPGTRSARAANMFAFWITTIFFIRSLSSGWRKNLAKATMSFTPTKTNSTTHPELGRTLLQTRLVARILPRGHVRRPPSLCPARACHRNAF